MSDDKVIVNGQDVFAIQNKLIPIDGAKSSAPRFVTKALTTKTDIYVMPHGSSRQDIGIMMAAMTLCGRGSDPSPTKWTTYVLTWSCLVFPELIEEIRGSANGSDYNIVFFPDIFIESVRQAVSDQKKAETAGDKFLTFPSGLPEATLVPLNGTVLAACMNLEGMYAYYAMLVFILGKNISAETIVAIGSKRPDALIRKRGLTNSAYILTGDGKINSENYRKIQSGWIRANVPREIIITHLCVLKASEQKPEIFDPIVVNMDMLAHSGQTYIYLIHTFVDSYSWALVEIPILRAQFQHYVRMVNLLARQPRHIQDYYKLIKQDTDKNFRRRDVEILAACAVYVEGQHRKTMKGYRVSTEARPTIALFQQRAKERGIHLAEVSDQATIETVAI